jgi:hypothetical protein
MMRRIQSKREEDKKHKRNQIILVVSLIIILLGSTFGVIIDSFNNSGESSENQISYKGKTLFYSEGLWVFEVNENVAGLVYSPYETEDIVSNVVLSRSLESYSNVPVYIYSEDPDSYIEIYRNIYPLAERIQDACPEGYECSNKNLPSKDCTNNLIIIEEYEKNEIVQEENCVYIRGEKESLIKISDDFVYRLYGLK